MIVWVFGFYFDFGDFIGLLVDYLCWLLFVDLAASSLFVLLVCFEFSRWFGVALNLGCCYLVLAIKRV